MSHSKEKLQLVRELHKPARKNFNRRHTIIKAIDDVWQADLAQMDMYAGSNKNYKYVLIVIDCFSKYLWTRPLKTKTAEEVAKAFETIFVGGRCPRNLQTDQGLEFFNSKLKLVMKKYDINHYHTYSCKKAAMAERVIRTIKERLFRYFSLNGSFKWIDVLPEIVDAYNNTKHRTIHMKPIEVTKGNERRVLMSSYTFVNTKSPLKNTFSVGDFVRISKAKHIFKKGYKPSWTTEVFKISKIQTTNPVTYLLIDLEGVSISGGFYKEELQKTKYPDVYLVEKVLKRRANTVYVKWLGFDNSHNSWVDSSNIL